MDVKMPLIGDKFPEITVKTTQGTISLPSHYSGKWLVLFSHPADFTPVCTTEFISFAKHYSDFQELNTELLGLSVDQVFPHLKWVQWIDNNFDVKIKFPIIADDQGIIAKKLGMIHPNKATNTVRAVFVVDNKAIVRAIIYYPQEVGRNMQEILRLVKALQTTDNDGVATPANWPCNEVIGSDVIIPPPATEKLAKERLRKINMGELEGFDWWFTYRKGGVGSKKDVCKYKYYEDYD
ncbi:peroxiredoxin [Dendrosporobacter sp. 1207_IL3150]|uniref:peroxiredoxin n=1 Tax=Dendrosporobacter sp. 1207_IL3150 TaxID=3084054 RepID=UPI002FD9F85B